MHAVICTYCAVLASCCVALALPAIEDSCTIEVVPNLSPAAFAATYKGERPVVFSRPLNDTQITRDRLGRSQLLLHYGSKSVSLLSVDSYGHETKSETLRHYIEDLAKPQAEDARANDSWYLFGEALGEPWDELVSEYPRPLDSAADAGLRAWGCGGLHSGVNFHAHGAVFAETLLGRKRWFLAPPSAPPAFSPHRTQLQWLLEQEDRGDGSAAVAKRGDTVGGERAPAAVHVSGRGGGAAASSSVGAGVFACSLGPGEVLYIPPGWWHATLNLADWTAFVSTFTMES